MKLIAWVAGLGLLAASGLTMAQTPPQQTAQGPGAEIASRTLPNGLQVIVWPDHDIPNVAMYTWFHVGSRNEHVGITGLAHFFEHMMFNGTKNHPQGDFDHIMEAAGGSNNAFTSEDVTVYEDWFPKTALDTIFQLESDRMANLSFKPKVVNSERGVVYSERRTRVDNSNIGRLMEQLQSHVFVAHPYHHPVIGWPSDIENWTQADLERFYKTYYAPNNATMILVGDVEPKAVFAKVEQYFAKIPSQPAPPKVTTVEPTQQGKREIFLKAHGQTPILGMAWHSGAANAKNMPALELLMSILTDGDSSRLHRLLVEETGTAINVGGNIHQGFDPGMTQIYAMLPTGGKPEKVEHLINMAIQRIAEHGVTQKELEKARNQHVAGYWRGLETISGKAYALGHYAVFFNDYHQLFKVPESYDAVTPKDIQTLAKTMFGEDKLTVAVLQPEDAPEGKE